MQAVTELNQQIQDCDNQIKISSAQQTSTIKEKSKLSASMSLVERVMKDSDMCYHSVGRAFLMINKPDFHSKITKDIHECDKLINTSKTNVEYLTKKKTEYSKQLSEQIKKGFSSTNN